MVISKGEIKHVVEVVLAVHPWVTLEFFWKDFLGEDVHDLQIEMSEAHIVK